MKALALFTLSLSLSMVSFGWALTIEEAVSTALKYNPQISQATAFAKASESREFKARSPFWPRVELTYNYQDGNSDPNYVTDDVSQATASASYNLFNGGSDWFRLHAAGARNDATYWQYQSVVADTVLAVRQAFIEVLRAEKNLQTASQSRELLKRQYREAELRLEQGFIARNDLLRVSVEMATVEQELVTAKSRLATSRAELSRVIGHPINPEETLVAVSLPEKVDRSFPNLQQTMLNRRSELKFLQSELDAQTAERKAVRGDLMPDVDFILSYDRFGNEFLPETSDPDYDSETTALLQASWTLFSGLDTHYELAGRKQEIYALKEEIRAVKDRLNLQLQSALEDYQVALTNLVTATASVQLAEENYRVNENRYKAQVATTVDLLDAQDFLTRARNEEIKAQFDLYNANVVIDRILEKDVPEMGSD